MIKNTTHGDGKESRVESSNRRTLSLPTIMCTNVSGTDHFAAKFNGATFASALSTLTSGVGRDDDTMSGAATEGRNGCSLWVRVKIGTRQRH